MADHGPQGPVAVGGLGGSGTRVVAQLLLALPFYLGADLNEAYDNLWFSVLLRRPSSLLPLIIKATQAGLIPDEISASLHLFEQAMRGMERLTPADLERVARAIIEVSYDHDPFDPRPGTLPWRWSTRCLASLARSTQVDRTHMLGWGWKEPNTHIYLRWLAARFPAMRYIHVVRHGLDMALSPNQGQLHNWGALYGVAVPDDPADLPRAALEYWIRANRAARERGQQLFGERFLWLNYETLCAAPEREIARLLAFLAVDPAAVNLAQLASLPQIASSAGRYRAADLRQFSAEQLAAVEAFGFAVEA